VGAITGAGLYVAGVVSGIVTIAATTRITVVPRVFLRDLSFYIVALCILVGSSFTKGIGKPFAGAFLGWYAIFIVIVAIEDWREKKEKKRAESELPTNELGEDLVSGEKERRLSAWEEDNEEEEKAKEEYLNDLVRQKTNTAINRASVTESEFEEDPTEKDEDEPTEEVPQLGEDEEHRVEGGLDAVKVSEGHFEDQEVDT
jgi:Ca2+/Na+ antiporter